MKTKMLQFRYKGIEFPFAIQDGEVIISQSVERTGAWEPEQLGLYSRYISPGGTFQAIAVNRCRAVPTVPD